MVSFAVQKLVSLIRSHLFIFVFISIALGDWPKKTLVLFMSENVFPMLSSWSFMVSCLMFESLSHFEFTVVYAVRVCSTSLIYMQLSNFPSTTFWRHCLSPILYSCLLCQRLTVGVWVYFWALYSVPLICMYVFVPIPCCFDYCSFVVLSEVWESYATLHCVARASHCSGFSCFGARALGAWASVVVARGLSSCGSWALEYRFSSCGTRA